MKLTKLQNLAEGNAAAKQAALLSRVQTVFDDLEEHIIRAERIIDGEVLKKLIKDAGFPATEISDLKKSCSKFYEEFEDLLRGVVTTLERGGLQEATKVKAKPHFEPVIVNGVEIFAPAGYFGGVVSIKAKSAEGRAVLARLLDSAESREFKKVAHWVLQHGSVIELLVRDVAENPTAAVKQLSKFISTLTAPEKKVRKSSAKSKVPAMEDPGVKVSMLDSWKAKLPKAIAKLGYQVEQSDREDTHWSVTFSIDKATFNKEDFTEKLRDELQMSGWMEVQFYDLYR